VVVVKPSESTALHLGEAEGRRIAFFFLGVKRFDDDVVVGCCCELLCVGTMLMLGNLGR